MKRASGPGNHRVVLLHKALPIPAASLGYGHVLGLSGSVHVEHGHAKPRTCQAYVAQGDVVVGSSRCRRRIALAVAGGVDVESVAGRRVGTCDGCGFPLVKASDGRVAKCGTVASRRTPHRSSAGVCPTTSASASSSRFPPASRQPRGSDAATVQAGGVDRLLAERFDGRVTPNSMRRATSQVEPSPTVGARPQTRHKIAGRSKRA